MAGTKVLIEILRTVDEPFSMHGLALESTGAAESQAADLLADIGGLGIEIEDDIAPVPMFSEGQLDSSFASLESFSEAVRPGTRSEARSAVSSVVSAEVSRSRIDELKGRDDIRVWPNSELTLFETEDSTLDMASSRSGTDCRPYREGVPISTLRSLLGVSALWNDGFRGQNTVVGIVDEGVNGDIYPVIGGFSRPDSGRQPGSAPITSHGSMCAADVLVAAPATRLYDYPFLGVPRSGGVLQMYQAILNQWRANGTPQITNNSFGFVGVPDPILFPDHEVHNINHPLHRKVREAVAAGVTCFFAAGNCGQHCPSGKCHSSGIGPGRSIHGSNSLEDVITVAAVNSVHERVGYSSEGPGMFFKAKPDIASYTHFYGNFGPNRPGGMAQPFDNGTSAATPVAAGVAAALLSAFPQLPPSEIKSALMKTAIDLGTDIGWNGLVGHGVVNAAAAYNYVKPSVPLVG